MHETMSLPHDSASRGKSLAMVPKQWPMPRAASSMCVKMKMHIVERRLGVAPPRCVWFLVRRPPGALSGRYGTVVTKSPFLFFCLK